MVQLSVSLRPEDNARLTKGLSKGQLFRNILTATKKGGDSAARKIKKSAIATVERTKVFSSGVVKSKHYTRQHLGSNPSWDVESDGEAIPISKLRHGQASWGVLFSANRGKTSRLKGAFIAKLANGHVGVFVRDSRKAGKRVTYTDKSGRRQTKALPIRQVYTSGISSGLKSAGDRDGIMRDGERAFLVAFKRTLRADRGLG